MKGWLDTHYPFHIPLIFLAMGIFVTWQLGENLLQPEREADLKKVCPDMSEPCLAKLTWEPSPLYFIIPFGFLAFGFLVSQWYWLMA